MNAQQVIEKYYQAWTNSDFSTVRSLLADNLDFRGSMDGFQTADAFMDALRRFVTMCNEVTLLQSYFNDQGGALLYDCVTKTPAGVMRTAEFITVSHEKICGIRLVFDATEFRKLMGQ